MPTQCLIWEHYSRFLTVWSLVKPSPTTLLTIVLNKTVVLIHTGYWLHITLVKLLYSSMENTVIQHTFLKFDQIKKNNRFSMKNPEPPIKKNNPIPSEKPPPVATQHCPEIRIPAQQNEPKKAAKLKCYASPVSSGHDRFHWTTHWITTCLCLARVQY